MAQLFELVVNYGADRAAAEHAGRLLGGRPPLTAGPHQVPINGPVINTVHDSAGEPYQELSVNLARVGWRRSGDTPLLLSAGELSELGHGLYSLLAELSGYRVAQAGWDPEFFADPVELRQEWAGELAEGLLPGLVIADDLRLGVPTHGFVPFTPGFLWIPYEGEPATYPGGYAEWREARRRSSGAPPG